MIYLLLVLLKFNWFSLNTLGNGRAVAGTNTTSATRFCLYSSLFLLWSRQEGEKTVAIVVLCRKSLQFLLAVLGKLRDQDDSVANIVAASPESIQGPTVQCCHFLCLQSRCRKELVPGGHSLDRERRWTGLTRASEQLHVYVQDMQLSSEASTRRLQAHVASAGSHLDLQWGVWRCLRSLCPETAGTLCQSLHMIDSIYDTCHGQVLRQLELARTRAPSCAEWMLRS